MPDWLTYQQIGEQFGLHAEAARTRVRRLGWRTQPGNDGRTLALVPDDADLRPGGVRADEPPGDREETGLTGLLTGALTALETALADAQQRADRAEAATAAERQRADAAIERAEVAIAGERHRAETANERAVVAQALADRALAQLTDAVTRADRAEAAVTGEHTRADVLRSDLDAAQRDARTAKEATQTALQAAATLRLENEARKARGRLRRVLAAWRGE